MAKTIRIPAIPVIWIVMGLFLPIEGVLLWAYHTASREWKDTIVFGATVVGGAFALYGHMKHIEGRRDQYAQKLIERWNDPSPEFELMKDTLRNVYAGTLNLASVMRTRTAAGQIVLPNDMVTRNRVVGLLNYCEEVALAVRTDQADEALVRRILSGVLEMAWDRFEPWIQGERTVLGPPHGDELYIELQKLVEKWK
jgi:hypothetical protein